MNKAKMIEDMKKALVEIGKSDEPMIDGLHLWADVLAETLYNKGYRKIADDEIVLKKDDYKELKKYRTDWLNDEKMHLQAELEDTEFELGCSNRLFQKVCEEKKELEKQLAKTKQETRDILQELKEKQIFMLENDLFGGNAVLIQGINEIAEKHGIELR